MMRSIVSFLALSVVGVAVSFDQDRAITYAQFAYAAYCPPALLKSWSCGANCAADVSSVAVCTGVSANSFVGLWEGKCLVSFEGTHTLDSILTDAKFWQHQTTWSACDGCKVHSGFLQEWTSMRSCVEAALTSRGCGTGSTIRTTGHSLGAATNLLAMMSLKADGWDIEESYHFGTPRTGDSAFTTSWNNHFGDSAFRVTHARDPVPHAPFSLLKLDYEHVEPEIFYKGNVSKGEVKCTSAGDKKCSEQYGNLPLDLLYGDDHVDYMGLSITCPSKDISV